MDEYDEIKKKLKLVFRQLTGKFKESDDALLPEIAIKGSGFLYCYYPAKKKFVRVRRGTKAFIISENETVSPDRILIYTFDGYLVEIEEDDIIYTGFD